KGLSGLPQHQKLARMGFGKGSTNYPPCPWAAPGAAASSQVERKPLSRCVYLVLLLGSPRLSRGTIGAEETPLTATRPRPRGGPSVSRRSRRGDGRAFGHGSLD